LKTVPSIPVLELIQADIPRLRATAPGAVARSVNWAVRPGEFWVVGALPGTGKTDLLSTAAGLQRPLAGTLRFFGLDTADMTEYELVASRLRVGMIFDTGRLFSHLTVAQNLALPLAYHSVANETELAERVDFILRITSLEPWSSRKPREISRNLHQRIGLARALALSPEALIIDNPLLNTDPREGRWWLDFLRRLNSPDNDFHRSHAIAVATDDFRPWLGLATHFAVLRDKHFEILGGPETLQHSADPLVRELMTSAYGEG